MAKKPGSRAEFVFFNVTYEDGSQRSNRRVPADALAEGDSQARGVIEEQDRRGREVRHPPAHHQNSRQSGLSRSVGAFSLVRRSTRSGFRARAFAERSVAQGAQGPGHRRAGAARHADVHPGRPVNLCGQAGFADITTTIIEVTVTFANFHKFWESQTIGYRPTTRSSMLWNPKERESVVLPL